MVVVTQYTVGTTLQPPIVALDYVTHRTDIKGWVGRCNADGEKGGEWNMGATCT